MLGSYNTATAINNTEASKSLLGVQHTSRLSNRRFGTCPDCFKKAGQIKLGFSTQPTYRLQSSLNASRRSGTF